MSTQVRRVVLLGFMGSGKSAIGRALARRLGWRHVDLDREIERREGESIEAIFRTRGEAAFRALEAGVTPEIARRDRTVVSPGGGWVTTPGNLESLPDETLTVWLKVSPDEVLRRLTRSRHQPVRPLLAVPDPREKIEELLAQREPLYRRAHVVLETDGRSVKDLAAALEGILRGRIVASESPASSRENGS